MKLQEKTYNFKVTKFEPLTDTQWAKIQNFVEKPYHIGRPRKVDLRKVLDGLRHLVRTGAQWRNVSEQYEKSAVLRYYYDKWKKDGTWSRILKTLVSYRRNQLGRIKEPTLGAIAAANRR